MSDIVFADGFYFKEPHKNAPEFVKGSLSIKLEDAIPFLTKYRVEGEWLNLSIKESKAGKIYIAVDDWKADNKEHEPPTHPEDESSLPF